MGEELVEEAMKKTSDVLKQYYDLDILKPKYRNLPYAAQIYEYLFNGLCDNLEGTHNAYFILEEELRVQRIIGKMDIIISQLEKIKDNQVTLYQAMQSVRYSVNKVNDSVVRFADSYSRHTRVVWAQNDELRRTLRDNQQQLNAKLDEANRNFQLAMKKEHDQSPVGTYLSEQSARDLSYIANYISYRDERPGPSYLG